MFLATTAVSEFWDTSQEILFLGPWCLLHEKKNQWAQIRHQILEDPWNVPGRLEKQIPEYEKGQERLLMFLTQYLNDVHHTRHSQRYWRILLGPWLMSYVGELCSHQIYLRSALEKNPKLESWKLDPADYIIPKDTSDHFNWIKDDEFNLQMISELMEPLGIPAAARRLPRMQALQRANVPPSWKSKTKHFTAQLSRQFGNILPSRIYFSDLYLDRRYIAKLLLESRLKIHPVIAELPSNSGVEARMNDQRNGLSQFQPEDYREKILVSCLPYHLPTIFLEGYATLRRRLLSDWPRLPKALKTSVGWFTNEYFKMLAAETTEAGGRLVISQHGGAYGMFQSMHRERHERSVADEYWTWGWEDKTVPHSAVLKRMPNPRLSSIVATPPAGRDWILACNTSPRYPFCWYMDNTPALHRFGDYLKDQYEFISKIRDDCRNLLQVRLNPHDCGWNYHARLTERFPLLRFDSGEIPWLKQLAKIRLAVMDHPQTTYLESLAANVPTILFWNPKHWLMRAEAQPYFDELRRVGILHDDPISAAAAVNRVIQNPRPWWEDLERQKIRRRFCERFAYGTPDWARRWVQELTHPIRTQTPT